MSHGAGKGRHGCKSLEWTVKTDVVQGFQKVLFLDQTTAASLKHQAHVAIPETANPQCFAKAGKMEPNHLLNGFGPLQPAVAML